MNIKLLVKHVFLFRVLDTGSGMKLVQQTSTHSQNQ